MLDILATLYSCVDLRSL